MDTVEKRDEVNRYHFLELDNSIKVTQACYFKYKQASVGAMRLLISNIFFTLKLAYCKLHSFDNRNLQKIF